MVSCTATVEEGGGQKRLENAADQEFLSQERNKDRSLLSYLGIRIELFWRLSRVTTGLLC